MAHLWPSSIVHNALMLVHFNPLEACLLQHQMRFAQVGHELTVQESNNPSDWLLSYIISSIRVATHEDFLILANRFGAAYLASVAPY